MIPVVMLAYPRNERDPICYDNGTMTNCLAKALREKGMMPYLSVPPETDMELVNGLGLDQWQIVQAGSSLPQHRLEELFTGKDWDHAVVLTAYSQFIDLPFLVNCLEHIHDTELVEVTPWASPNAFWIVGKEFVTKLASVEHHAVLPFYFHRYATELLSVDKRVVIKNESPFVRVCHLLFGHIERKDIGYPEETFVKMYRSWCKEEQYDLFLETSFLEFMSQRFGVTLPEHMHTAIDRVFPPTKEMDKISSIFSLLRKHSRVIPNPLKTFLELGFGSTPISSYFLSYFAEKGYAVEPFTFNRNLYEDSKLIARLLATLEESIPTLSQSGLKRRAQTGELTIVEDYLESQDIPDESIDFCFSLTVLEHIFSIAETIEYLSRKLSKGGVMLHYVDFKDHGRTKPFEFYRYSMEEWQSMQQTTTLLRVNDMKRIFEKFGFSILEEERTHINDLPEDMHPFWNTYRKEDLTTSSCLFVLKKVER